jgi:sec-independent protein translocase protein TatA
MGLDNPLHIAALVVLVLLVFGARRLPEIGRSLGSGMREFKESITGESKPPADPTPAPPTLGSGEHPPAQPPAQTPPAQPVASQASPGATPPPSES